MQNSATIKPILYLSKTLKNGKHPVMLQIIKDRKVRRISLGYSASVKEWDFKNFKPSKKHPYQKELEALIKQKEASLSKQVLALDMEEKNYTSEIIIQKVNKKRKSISVMKYFDELISGLKAANRIGSGRHYKTCKNVLLAFNNQRDLAFVDIDSTYLTKLENHFKTKGWKETSIASYMRTLRAAYNKAINENIISADLYPFKQYKLGKLNIKTQKRAIKVEHIVSIEALVLESNTRLFLSKNIFLFSFYTMGTNFADMASLTWDKVKDGRLKYERAKTGKLYNIVLSEKANDILNYYKSIKSDKYIFPIYSEESHITHLQKSNRLNKVLHHINKDLKIIAEKCKIDENITTYVARHSAATILKRKGVSTSVISELLGHETEGITQIYLDSFESQILDTAVEML